MKKIRISDVAAYAGVAKSTVSQYLNGRFHHMSKETKARIQSAIKVLNYVPNPIAQSLKSNKTKTIGVIVRDICGFNTSHILRGIDDFCKKSEYNVLIYNTDFDEETELNSLLALRQMRVDGIIMSSSGKNSKLINQYVKEGLPFVQFQMEYHNCPTDIVLSDYQIAAQKATEYLINLGHRRIVFLTQQFTDNHSRYQRYKGYIDAHQIHDIPLDEQLIQYWDRDLGFQFSPIELLKMSNAPTAFFTQHLAITTDLLKLLNDVHIAVPSEVSIIAFDEIPMVEMFKVPITTIRQNTYQIGVEAAKLLLSSLNENNPTEMKLRQTVTVPCQLVKRASCQSINCSS